MKKIFYIFCLVPALSFATDIDVAMYDEAYVTEGVEDIHVAMYDEAYPTNESSNVAKIFAYIEGLPPAAAGPLKELADCNDY
ncbi:MAG: hypothetical protein KZQ83_11210 [gamma proteobacterium symbiont of Taylorina sp.]|nr:hypothetical protein [gamma proteobacterium symbiont of Taylorina sp.]